MRRILSLIFFILAMILLYYLLKYQWDINAAVKAMLSLIGR